MACVCAVCAADVVTYEEFGAVSDGKTDDMAAMLVNGYSYDWHDLGTVWCAPWHVKVPSGVLKARGNVIEIDVTNTWRNRLIGDELEPPDVEFTKAPYPGGDMMLAYPDWFGKGIASRPSKGRKCFATWNYFNADAKDKTLMPSGLVGPVTVGGDSKWCAKRSSAELTE